LAFAPISIVRVVEVGSRCSILDRSEATFESINGSTSSYVGSLIFDVAITINCSIRGSNVWLSKITNSAIEPTTKLTFFFFRVLGNLKLNAKYTFK
jgi:hypothetical protein